MNGNEHTAEEYQEIINELAQYVSIDKCLVNPVTGKKTRGKVLHDKFDSTEPNEPKVKSN